MIVLGDFQVPEPATLLTYSRPAAMEYRSPESCLSTTDTVLQKVSDGEIPQSLADAQQKTFGLMSRFYDVRYHPGGIMSQNILGMIGGKKTTQDHLPLTSRLSADWFRNKHAVGEDMETQVSSLSFIMDAALSFIPLAHSGLTFADAGAVSSLDFALRIFKNKLDLDEFHCREFKTVTGGAGRTFSESHIWDQKGDMVASMSQMSILRPKPKPKL
jgi:hypothetical protein